MNKVYSSTCVLILLILFSGVSQTRGQTSANDDLRFEIFLSSQMLNDVKLDIPLINAYQFTENQNILLSTPEQFYLLGAGSIVPFGRKNIGEITDFAFTRDQVLMVVRNNKICTIDSSGMLKQLYVLPSDGMGISPGKHVMYVYNKKMNANSFSLYVIAERGKYNRLLEVARPIMSVAEHNDKVYFASGNGVFSYHIPTKSVKGVVSLKEDRVIRSLALDTLKNILYFATDNEIFAFYNKSVITISSEFGGNLKYYHNGLLVFHHKKKYIIRISGIVNEVVRAEEKKPVKPKDKTSEVLTNSSVINLVNAKLSDELIINLIKNSEVNFDVSVDAIISLSNLGVSSQVINAMVEAMKKQ